MGPPSYGRTQSQPYQVPLAILERKMMMGERGERRQEDSSPQLGLGLLPVSPQVDNDNIFEVTVKRNSLGLGFSITGGPEAPSPWTNLIRIKKVFPLQPAWETGHLKVGDVILKVSGTPLTSLSLRQALDILRSSPPVTSLQVCRIPEASIGNSWHPHTPPKSRSSVVRSYSYGPNTLPSWDSFRSSPTNHTATTTTTTGVLEQNGNFLPLGHAGRRPEEEDMEIEVSPATPPREWSPGVEEDPHTLDLLKPVETALKNSSSTGHPVGEFKILLRKVNGSLGFTLQSTDETVLKHTVKALVKEPAVSDGRIRPGDKLLSANGVDLSSFSHQEVISYLRQCCEEVELVLYRDASRSQTPLTPETAVPFPPTYLPVNRVSHSPSRKNLRYEAKELVRSLQSSRTSLEKAGLSSSPNSYRTSGVGGGGSGTGGGGTLGRRLGRPFSPASRDRQPGRSHSREGGSCMRQVSPGTGGGGGLSLLCPGSPVPQIESPAINSAPPSLGSQVAQAFGNLRIGGSLRIEEVDSRSLETTREGDGYSPLVTSQPDSPVLEVAPPDLTRSLPRDFHHSLFIDSESGGRRVNRPSDLNFGQGGDNNNKKRGYVFSPCNSNSGKNNNF